MNNPALGGCGQARGETRPRRPVRRLLGAYVLPEAAVSASFFHWRCFRISETGISAIFSAMPGIYAFPEACIPLTGHYALPSERQR